LADIQSDDHLSGVRNLTQLLKYSLLREMGVDNLLR
jgi:hypothetical protein